jgi:hypothetical protein
VLEKGLVKRIGDGNLTNIWHDRWLPNHFDGKPLVMPDNPSVTSVSELITASRGWNEALIKHVFVRVDANVILSTPIRGTVDDRWAWELKKHGIYSVRSAYRQLYNDQWQQGDTNLVSTSEDRTWTWHLEVVCTTKGPGLLVARRE